MTSKIEWTNETWNPVTGCSPISPGCHNCYAKNMTNRLKGRCGYHHTDPFKITLHKDKFSKPSTFKKPRKVFVCSMGDLFHKDVPDAWIDAVMKVTSMVPQHTYLILTKRPERMFTYITNIVKTYNITIPNNLWFGVTAENQEMADYRIPFLLDLPVENKFVSIEPMLGPVNIASYISKLDWIIVGGETGKKARYMDPGWAVAVKNLCLQNAVPFFFKQMSMKAPAPIELLIKQFPSSMP